MDSILVFQTKKKAKKKAEGGTGEGGNGPFIDLLSVAAIARAIPVKPRLASIALDPRLLISSQLSHRAIFACRALLLSPVVIIVLSLSVGGGGNMRLFRALHRDSSTRSSTTSTSTSTNRSTDSSTDTTTTSTATTSRCSLLLCSS